MSPKCTYLFRHTSVYNSRIKRILVGIVEEWMNYRKVIRNIVRVKPKHGEKSYGDCMVSKHDFRDSQKINAPIFAHNGVHWPRKRVWKAHYS